VLVFKKVLHRVLRVPSHATVVAYLALFMSMGGTAYATVEWTGANIADGSLTGADVADGSLSGSDIQAGSISSTDLAPGTLDTSGGAAAGSLLAKASNPDTVSGPLYTTGTAQVLPVVSLSFSVPAGHRYQVQLNAHSRVTEVYTDCGGQTSWLGGNLAVIGDGDASRSLTGFATGSPEGVTDSTQALVFGPGDHTVAVANVSSACITVKNPGSVSMADSFLSATLLADFQ
jgi:hypothetical protein